MSITSNARGTSQATVATPPSFKTPSQATEPGQRHDGAGATTGCGRCSAGPDVAEWLQHHISGGDGGRLPTCRRESPASAERLERMASLRTEPSPASSIRRRGPEQHDDRGYHLEIPSPPWTALGECDGRVRSRPFACWRSWQCWRWQLLTPHSWCN